MIFKKNKLHNESMTSGNIRNNVHYNIVSNTATDNFKNATILYEKTSFTERRFILPKSIYIYLKLGLIVMLILYVPHSIVYDVNNSYNYHTKLAERNFHNGNYPEMLYHLKEMVKIDPKDVNTYSDIAYYYFSLSINDKERREEFQKKSINYLLEGLKNNKNDSNMWEQVGNFFVYNFKDVISARPFYEKAITFKNCRMTSYHFLAAGYYKQKNYDKAIEILEECVKKFPDDKKAISKIIELKKMN